MPQVIRVSRCACGAIALITKHVDGVPVHLCADCMMKPPSLRERDYQMLIKLGLIQK